jgi:hypothetical protein
MAAHERPNAGAVDNGNRAQVDEHALDALFETGLNELFELLGRPSSHQILLRRQHELTGIGTLRKKAWHPSRMIT